MLLDVVEQHYPGTKAEFESDFWTLLVTPRLSYPRLNNIIRRLLKKCGFVRPTSGTARLLNRFIGSRRQPKDEVTMWPSELHFQAFSELAKRGTLDSLALLTALAIELQMSRSDPLVATLSQEVHMHCCTAFGKLARTSSWERIRMELWVWYQLRVFDGNWDNPPNIKKIFRIYGGHYLMPLLPAEKYGTTLAKKVPSGSRVPLETIEQSYRRAMLFYKIDPPWVEPGSAQ